MRAKVTHDQLHMPFTEAINNYLGITTEILEKIGWEHATLDKTYVGELIDNKDGTYLCPLNISNCDKLPRRVAIREVNKNDVAFWTQLVGKENIIN